MAKTNEIRINSQSLKQRQWQRQRQKTEMAFSIRIQWNGITKNISRKKMTHKI